MKLTSTIRTAVHSEIIRKLPPVYSTDDCIKALEDWHFTNVYPKYPAPLWNFMKDKKNLCWVTSSSNWIGAASIYHVVYAMHERTIIFQANPELQKQWDEFVNSVKARYLKEKNDREALKAEIETSVLKSKVGTLEALATQLGDDFKDEIEVGRKAGLNELAVKAASKSMALATLDLGKKLKDAGWPAHKKAA